jgi:hypothetical protein
MATMTRMLRKAPLLNLLLLAVLFPYIAALSGCAASNPLQGLKMAPMSQMTEDVKAATPLIQQAYQFAAANRETLQQIPCYCGCATTGHTSNYDCYIVEIKPAGEIVTNPHALGCAVCVLITQDVMKMTREGKSIHEIRAAIDQTYSKYGPSTGPFIE